MAGPGRALPALVKAALRQEVGFRCPVEGCGSPYLTWYHFDPRWHVEAHHRPEGMIALCREHADKAAHGAFTDDQLRQLKREGRARAANVRGRFEWMRRDLLAVVGGNFFHNPRVIFQIGDIPCIWFNRDEAGYLLLNFRMPTTSGQPRIQIDDNFWSASPEVGDLVCPPTGKFLEVKYSNGDRFQARFFIVDSLASLDERYPPHAPRAWYGELQFPLTVVELWETAADTNIEFGPRFTRIGGGQIVDCFISGGEGPAFRLDVTPDQLASLFPDQGRPFASQLRDVSADSGTSVRGTGVSELIRQVEVTRTAADKGKALEILMVELFEQVPGFSLHKSNVRTETEEIDLVVLNGSPDPVFCKDGPLVLVECKNWSKKPGRPEFSVLEGKIRNRHDRCTVAFLISWSGFSETTWREALRVSREKYVIVCLTGKEVRDAALAGTFPALLRQATLDALTKWSRP